MRRELRGLMTMNAFDVLGLPQQAALSEEEVRAAYFEKSKSADADRSELNAAFELLLAPEKRLRHLIDLAAPDDAKQWRTVTMSDDLMSLFMALGKARPDAEDLIEKRIKAQTALSKALLEGQTFSMRETLEEIGTALDAKRNELESSLASVEDDWQGLAAAQARFAYLAKWQAQVRELLLKLM
jgi:curved DNA-binding protein CbpA